MESNVKNVNKDIIGVILVGIVLIMGVYIFTSLADIGGTTEYFSSSENSTMNTSSVFIAPVSDGVSSFSAQTYNQTWLNFDGVNDWINITSINSQFHNGTGFTYLIALKLINSTTTSCVFSSGFKSNLPNYNSLQWGTDNLLDITFINGSGADLSRTNVAQLTEGKLDVIVFLYNGTSFKIYLNNVLVSTRNDLGEFNIQGNQSALGQFGIGGSTHFFYNGSVYDFRFINKPLTTLELTDLYNYYISMEDYYNNSITKENISFYDDDLFYVLNSTNYYFANVTGFYQSNDRGITLSELSTDTGGSTGQVLWRSKQGVFYMGMAGTGNISISTDNGVTWNYNIRPFVCDNSSGEGYGTAWYFADTNDGGVLVGEYATNNISIKNCSYIHKTIDNGTTWNIVYNGSEISEYAGRHIHIVATDPYTGYNYATQGDAGLNSRLLRSINNGEDWTTIENGTTRSQYITVVFTPNCRIFGTDVGDGSSKNQIVKTCDDMTFNTMLSIPTAHGGYVWSASRDDKTGYILFGTVSVVSGYPQAIYLSKNDGDTWYSLERMYTTSSTYKGFNRISNFDEDGYFLFSDNQNSKIYLVNINDLNTSLVSRYEDLKFNENSGTTAYDSSGNGNNGTISGATWQNDGVLVSLTEDTDYSISNNGLLSLLNSNYLYSYIVKYWTYFTESTNPGTVASLVMVDSLGNSTTFLSILIVISFAVVILTLFKPSVNTNPLGKPHY